MVMKLKAKELQTDWRKTTTWIPLHFRKFFGRAGEPDGIYLYKKVRCHNRQIHKFKTLKGGIRKLNQALHNSRIRLFDKVRINNHTGFIYGRRQSGPCLVKDIDGNIISSGISYKS